MARHWTQKPLLALGVASATALALELGYNGGIRGRTPLSVALLQGPSPEARGEVAYADLRGEPSRFERLPAGFEAIHSEWGERYTQALFVPDLDGDGAADLALALRELSYCGNDVRGGLELLSGSGRTPIGEYAGYAAFEPEIGPSGGALVVRSHGWRGPLLLVRERLIDEPLWQRELGGFGSGVRATFVGDLDGDGRDEVAVTGGSERGQVALLDGESGRHIWMTFGPAPEEDLGDFGEDLASIGDWNSDGTPDLAVLAERALVFLSGTDGVELERARPVTNRLRGLEAVGDLDGDGRTDFRLWIDESPGWDRPFVSSANWGSLDVAGGWRVLWVAPGAVPPRAGGDLDGDGHDDLVLGRQHPETRERRLSVYSAAGLRDVRTIEPDHPTWEPELGCLATPAVGRIRAGEPWLVLLPLEAQAGWNTRGLVAVIPGD